MSDQPPRPDPAARPSGPAGLRRVRPKTPNRVHPPVKRTMRDYWVMFRERWFWGLLPALIIGGVLAYLETRKPRYFTSVATLQFSARPGAEPRPETTGGIGLATHVDQMRSASFRERVVASLTPDEIQLIRGPYLRLEQGTLTGPDAKTILADAITITPREHSPFIDVSSRHPDGAAAEIITNRFARTFVQFKEDMAGTHQNDALTEIDARERAQRQRVEAAAAQLQEFRDTHPTGSQTNSEIVAHRLGALTDQLVAARRERTQLETTIKQIDDARHAQQSLTQIPYIANFRGIPALSRELESLQAERALLERKYLENHPKMKANQLEIDARTGLLRRNIDDAIAELRAHYTQALSAEEQILREQKTVAAEQTALDQSGPTLRELERRLASARELHAEIEKQRNELLIARGLDSVTVGILDRASAAQLLPRDWRRPLLQGGAAALVLFFIIPLAFGLSDTRLKAAWEVEQFLKENLLGEMPSIDGLPRKERPHIMARDLDHGAAEAFRGLFGQLQLNSTVPYPKLLMLTSTLPGEGKSVIANNLAATFAGHGKRTLLVDCDFRRPNLHVFYGKDNACGIMRWLELKDDLKTSAFEDQDLGILPLQENFYLLRAGGESRRATELFEMESFARLFGALRKQFDILIIDTPPVGVFPDSMLLSRMVDEIACVCRFNAVNRSKIRKCIERLRTPNAAFAGIVLNGIPSGKQSAHYDYYGYGANEAKRYKAYYAQRR